MVLRFHDVVALVGVGPDPRWGGIETAVVAVAILALIGAPLAFAWWRGWYSGAIGGTRRTVSAIGDDNPADALDRKLRRPHVWTIND